MLTKRLLAIGLATCPLAGCGGGDDTSDPTMPAAPTAITCAASAAALVKNTLRVGSVDREYYESAPANYAALRENDARGITVLVNFHDSGQSGQSGAADTCWNEVGESRGFVTIFPSAVEGQWNTKATTTAADEVAFLKALLPVIKTKYALASNAMVYYTGVGQGARMAQAMAMQAPQFLGGVAGVGGTADAEVFALPAAQLPRTTIASWIIKRSPTEADPNEAQQVAYWNTQNAVFTPPAAEADASFTSQLYSSQDRPAQSVKVSAMKLGGHAGKALSEEIWDKMFSRTVRFFDDSRTNGSIRQNKSISDMKLIETTKVLVAGAPARRWLTYLPNNYAALTANGGKLPLVISYHGRNGSGRWQALISEWHSVAEQRGFIVVYPQGIGATWTGSIATDNPDVLFSLALIDELKSQYAVDPTRIILNGASMGSLFTNRMAVQYPQLFAAIAPCYSGHLSAANYTNAIVRTDIAMPTWQCRGQDEVPSDFPGGTSGEAAAQVFWRETVNKNTGIPSLQLDDRRVSQIWNNGVAEYRWQVTEYQPHFWNEGQARKMWDEMLSKYARAADGQLIRLP